MAAAQGSKGQFKDLETPAGLNKRCDLPPEAYWVSESQLP